MDEAKIAVLTITRLIVEIGTPTLVRPIRGRTICSKRCSEWWGGLHLAREIGLLLSIDTARAAQDEARPILFHTSEGQYNAFTDALQMTIAAISYEGESYPLTEDWLTQLWPHL